MVMAPINVPVDSQSEILEEGKCYKLTPNIDLYYIIKTFRPQTMVFLKTSASKRVFLYFATGCAIFSFRDPFA